MSRLHMPSEGALREAANVAFGRSTYGAAGAAAFADALAPVAKQVVSVRQLARDIKRGVAAADRVVAEGRNSHTPVLGERVEVFVQSLFGDPTTGRYIRGGLDEADSPDQIREAVSQHYAEVGQVVAAEVKNLLGIAPKGAGHSANAFNR